MASTGHTSALGAGSATSLNAIKGMIANMTLMMNDTQTGIAQTLEYEDDYLKGNIIDMALLTMLFGLFTVLTAVAVYVLCKRGIKRKSTAAMLSAICIMWLSTVMYWITCLLSVARVFLGLRELTSRNGERIACLQSWLGALSGSDISTEVCRPQLFDQNALGGSYHAMEYDLRSCTGTLTLTINVAIGDAIVWWRAWVLWPNNRIVRSGCVLMILLVLVMGTLDSVKACTPGDGHPGVPASGTLFVGSIWGSVAVLISLLTNACATILIAYRTWEHRRTIMVYLKNSSRRSQVQRTLALLVESGVLYCALWVSVAFDTSLALVPVNCATLNRYSGVFAYIMSDSLIPVIGMYPTLIVILCAAGNSLNERSFEEHSRNNPGVIAMSSRRNNRSYPGRDTLSTWSVNTFPETIDVLSEYWQGGSICQTSDADGPVAMSTANVRTSRPSSANLGRDEPVPV